MTYEADLKRVKNCGNHLRYVAIQTPEICLAAVQENGWALKYVKEQTPELIRAACRWFYIHRRTMTADFKAMVQWDLLIMR